MKLKIISIIVIILLTFSSGFAQKKKKDKKKKEKSEAPALKVVKLEETPKPILSPVFKQEVPQNGSLFTTQGQNVSLITDFKAQKVGDLVFINVIETSLATVNSSADRNKDSGSSGIGSVVAALPIPGASTISSVIGGLGNRTFEGDGSTQRNSNVRARITARVIEIMPNGDLRIQAVKQVKINKETEQLAVTGIVRKNDLARDNSIPTTFVGDLRVEFNGKGVASNENAPGWLARLFDKINPF